MEAETCDDLRKLRNNVGQNYHKKFAHKLSKERVRGETIFLSWSNQKTPRIHDASYRIR